MSNYTTLEKGGFEPCPDQWAKLHVFYNPETKQVIPARCKRWNCFACAKINYYKVDYLATAGNPERFITLTRAGTTPNEIRINLQKLIQGLRRLGLKFEYLGVTELHLNGQAHLHLMQRGDFILQAQLSDMWAKYTAASYQGAGSSIVDIRYIHPNQNVKGYLLKYLKKSWQLDSHNPKSWAALQNAYPGLNHYRMSRNWLPKQPEKVTDWQLVPKASIELLNQVEDPADVIFYTDVVQPLTPIQALRIQSRKKLSRA